MAAKSRRITMNLKPHYANPAGPGKRELEKAVVKAAVEWWASKRPSGWTAEDQEKQPWVNLATHAENDLARAVARLKGKEKRNGRK